MAQPNVPTVPALRSTVLVVDDQLTGRAILEQVVRRIDSNVQVESFDNPIDAIQWATGRLADLVLVDYQMPQMDGIEFLRRLRRLPDFAHVPVVMVTMNDSRKVRYSALDAGVSDFLNKPIDVQDCLARCRNLMILRRQQLVLEEARDQLEAQLREAQKMKTIGTLATGVAHDINNMLGEILCDAALASKDIGAGRETEALVSLEGITKAGTHAKKLVRQILRMAA